MDDQYFTIASASKAEIKEKGSRFIGETVPVDSVESALTALDTIRKREHAATHHCYAYIVRTEDGPQYKYSDDGEPNGTAGKPIYDVIEGHLLVNLICVVTRYFGGTKLGTGGLVRAYSGAAKEVIEQSGRLEQFIWSTFDLEFTFPVYDQVNRLLQKSGAETIESEFGETVKLRVKIRQSKAEQLVSQLTELTAGKATIRELL